MKTICAVVGSRANYSSIKSALRAIDNHPDLELKLIVGASALLDRYGAVVNLIGGYAPPQGLAMLDIGVLRQQFEVNLVSAAIVMPERISIFSNSGTVRKNSSYCSSLQKPIT